METAPQQEETRPMSEDTQVQAVNSPVAGAQLRPVADLKLSRQIPLAVLLLGMAVLVIALPMSDPAAGRSNSLMALQITQVLTAIVLLAATNRWLQYIGALAGIGCSVAWAVVIAEHFQIMSGAYSAIAVAALLVCIGMCVRVLVSAWKNAPARPRDGFELNDALTLSVLSQVSTGCLQCNYDLRGISKPTCPECGTPVRLFASTSRRNATPLGRVPFAVAIMGVSLSICVATYSVLWIVDVYAQTGFAAFNTFSGWRAWGAILFYGINLGVGVAAILILVRCTPLAGVSRFSRQKFITASCWLVVLQLAMGIVTAGLDMLRMLQYFL